MTPVFGMDVTSTSFDPSKGCQVYHINLADLLLIRFENINPCARETIQHSWVVNTFHLIFANLTVDKDDHDAYQTFHCRILLRQATIDRMVASRYAQHFYNKGKIDSFRAKWLIP